MKREYINKGKACSAPGCTRPAQAWGLCLKHRASIPRGDGRRKGYQKPTVPTVIDHDLARSKAESVPDGPSAPEPAAQAQLSARLKAALDMLPFRRRVILALRFGLDSDAGFRTYTYKQIGQIIGLSTERVRQLEAEALRTLKHPARAKALEAEQGEA